jgi:hypothetical protein
VTATKESIGADAQLDVWRRQRGGPSLIRGRTAFIYDSFGAAMLKPLGQYTEELASVLWFETPSDALIEAIKGARTVVLEKVERDANYFASDQGQITPEFLDLLEARLKE